jgi:ATP-dependent Clp protease adaptor protein ClpS
MIKHRDAPSTLQNSGADTIKSLILFNDDINTFDFVIECLIDVCNHSHEQAEQCTLIAHYKGKCPVKEGEYSDLRPLSDKLRLLSLTVSIE